MNVVLLNSSVVSALKDYIQRTWSHPRVGVASVAAYLRARGCNVSLLDPQLDKLDASATAERIVALKPVYVGLPAYTEEIHDAALIASEVKRRAAEVVTIIGGPHVSALPEDTLREFPSLDIGIVGEGERPFEAIVSGTPRAEIRGIVFRDTAGRVVRTPDQEDLVSMDALPPPAWDLYELERYAFSVSVEMARCCPFSCAFCFKAMGKRPRYKSPVKALDEIAHCVNAYGVRRFYFSSNGTYPLDRDHAMAVCQGLVERGLTIEWQASTRVDVLDEELIGLMKKAGCSFIDFGIESGDPEILRRCGKGTDLDRIQQTIDLCYRAGIETELNFILGLPYETRGSLENTRRLARKLRKHSTVANFAILTPFPGTEVYEMALRHEGGLRLKTRDWRLYQKQGGQAIAHDKFGERELVKYQTRLYLSYYLGSPRKILDLLTSKNAAQLFDIRRAMQLLKRLF